MIVKIFQPLPPNIEFSVDAKVKFTEGAPFRDKEGKTIGRVIHVEPKDQGIEITVEISVKNYRKNFPTMELDNFSINPENTSQSRCA